MIGQARERNWRLDFETEKQEAGREAQSGQKEREREAEDTEERGSLTAPWITPLEFSTSGWWW